VALAHFSLHAATAQETITAVHVVHICSYTTLSTVVSVRLIFIAEKTGFKDFQLYMTHLQIHNDLDLKAGRASALTLCNLTLNNNLHERTAMLNPAEH
jgi:hypothetical protein